VYEEYMKKVVMETFGRCKESLIANLECGAIDGVITLE
jgi:hypothetical protein